MADTLRGWLVAARPPKELLPRLQWFFLGFGLFFVVTYLPQLVVESNRAWPVRGLGAMLLISLGLWWLRCYRRGHFPAWGLLLECATFVACVLIPSDPFKGLGLLYIAVNFRCLYGSLRQVLGFSTLALACFTTASLVAPHLGSVDRTSLLAFVLPGVPPLAAIAYLVAVASARADRSTARERLLSRAGLAIAEAGTVDATRGEALAAVTRLLADVPGATAEFVDLGGRSSGPVARPDAAGARHTDIPLSVNGRLSLVLRIASPATLPDEVGDALSIIAAQSALALSNVDLTQDLRRRASHDGLTGLANRVVMEEWLTAALARSAPRSVAVMMIDLDRFKQVNDTLGHAAGDVLLVTVAGRLADRVRGGDLLARLGGDEFVVILTGVRDPGEAVAAGNGLLEVAGLPVRVQDRVVTVGASIGIAFNDAGTTPAALLKAADEAMYQAKRAGKNRVHLAGGAPDGVAAVAGGTAELFIA
jgi:diguanylate cyclase (GGDEF)-like protein